ncbi:MAG: hypothetical protein MUF48_20785, partial [Pirellulaceae bacterium]|nr:hypothetical protein [Pirellulaceae bacterium]
RLWWPEPQPALYRLRTQLVVDGQEVDAHETLFGFRQWQIDGVKFTLNGVPWHMWADLSPGGETPDEVAASYHRNQIRSYRYSTAGQGTRDPLWRGLEPPAALEFFDRHGLVIRRNTTLDGETIGSQFAEQDPVTVQQQNGSQAKLKLMANWLDQCVAQVKGERNHPSIQIWTIENEFAYINLINLLGNSPLMDEYEGYIKKTHDAVLAVDRTRSVMIDGGGALKDNSLSVHGDHYVATFDQRYPDLAYETFAEGGGRGRWRWDQQRPRFLGEDYYATGINPADYALWGGEVCFQGKAATRDAMALMYRMLQEGYRWNGEYAAWHFWIGSDGGPAQWVANAPRLALVREWDWTFGSAQPVKRTFGVFNDTQHTDPVSFTRTLTFDGREVYRKTTEHHVAPGSAEKFEEVIPMPTVTRRTEGELHLRVGVGDQEVFHDTKAVSVLPPPALQLGDGKIAVYDPQGPAAALLAQLGAPVTRLTSLEAVPADARLLLVGSDALTAPQSTATTLAAFAAPGRAVVVLDQSTPLKYQAIPAEMELASDAPPLHEGRIAFLEDASHPALAGLQDKDFFTWPGADSTVYRHPYVKPTRGGKSLLQVGRRLSQTALVEIPVGKGVMYLTQLQLGDKLHNAVPAQVFVNVVNAAAQYRQVFAPVVAIASDPQLTRALDAVGVQYDQGTDPVAALADPGCQIAVLSATPETLRSLAAQQAALRSFWDRGGTILFHGLTPEGLADFNLIVGVEHVIRPFRRERVVFPAVRNPLTSGLTTGDVVMLSGQRIFGWTADEYVASDVFTHVVNLDDIAPFSTSTFFGWENMVNGFVGSDGWPLIMDFAYPEDGSPYEFTIRFPGPYTVREYVHDQSVNYNATTRLALLFDGQDRQEFALTSDGEEVVCTIDPPRTCRELTVQLLEWTRDPNKAPNIGMDNIRVMVQPPSSYVETVRPMLNIGGLVQYVQGAGGVVLCNLNFQETESVPVNAIKKRAILATVLRNLRAPFAGGKTVIAGGDVDYLPLDIHTRATTYKDERGFFGDAGRTLKHLPAGRNTLAGVVYDIYELATSPVPQVLMLGGPGVPLNPPREIRDIPVNAKADALFFLHTARIDNRPDDRQRREKQYPVMFQYVVHYSDGQTESIPVRSELDIEHYVQEKPQALPGAQLAWTGRYENSDDYAAAYGLQWNNPRPDVLIRSIDMEYVDDSRGVPVLLAVTAAVAR